MNEGSFYVLSNACMNIFPTNARSIYSNTLTKPIKVRNVGVNSLWLALESVTIENSIIQYKNTDVKYDLLHFDMQSNKVSFSMPEKCFENADTFINFFSHNCKGKASKGKLLKDIKLINGFINIKTNGLYTLISSRFFRFLGFTDTEHVRVLGETHIDGRLKDYHGNYYVLCLPGQNRNLTADQPFDLNIFTPNLLKIISPNISSYECGGGYKNILCNIPLNHTLSAITFIPAVSKFFKLNSDCLNNISVKIVDEHDLPINFTIGPPTIIKLRFKEMMNDANNFYVQISNNDSADIFPDNSTSNFKSKLPKVINLENKWLLALASVYIPPNIINFSQPMNIIEISKRDGSNNSDDGTNSETVVLPVRRCTILEDLLTLLNTILGGSEILFYKIKGKVNVTIKNSNQNKEYKLKLHIKLACMLGFSQEKIKYESGEHVFITFLHKNNDKTSKYQFDDVPNLEFSIPSWLLLYCDIVSPTNMRHSAVSILKIIPIQNKSIHNLNGVFTEFTNLEYFPIQVDSFQTLSFQLRTHDGYFVHFDGNENVQLTLSFQKSI